MSSIAVRLAGYARVLLAVLLAASLWHAPAAGGEAEDQAKLLSLFAALKTAPNLRIAKTIEGQIWDVWLEPSDPMLATRLGAARFAVPERGPQAALALFNQLIADYPDFAEAYNQRAILHAEMGDYDASLADIGKTLELEPRHFGALSGRIFILLELGRDGEAMRDVNAALAVYPLLYDRSQFPNLLEGVPRA